MAPGDPGRARWALAASLVLHVAGALVVGRVGTARAQDAASPDRPDAWVGETFEIDDVLGRPPPLGAPVEGNPLGESRSGAEAEPSSGEPPERAPAQDEPGLTDDGAAERARAERDEAERARAERRRARRAERAVRRAEREGAFAEPPSPEGSRPSASAPEHADGGGAASGSRGLPPGTRNLAKAFARALPIAGYHDQAWANLPSGPAGRVRVTLVVAADGALESSEIHGTPPPHLARLVERTARHLRVGRFALATGDATAGRETLSIDVHLSDGAPSSFAGDRPGLAVQYGFDPPTLGRPGAGRFTLSSGRRFEARVAIEASRPDG